MREKKSVVSNTQIKYLDRRILFWFEALQLLPINFFFQMLLPELSEFPQMQCKSHFF